METYDEWFYHELLNLLKQKEKEQDDAFYLPIQAELPIQSIGDEITKEKEDEQKDRGVTIIDF